jgi:hypothetical protein
MGRRYLTDAEFYAIASDKLTIGRGMNLTGTAEPTPKALANYEQERRKSQRALKLLRVERPFWMFRLVAAAGLAALLLP